MSKAKTLWKRFAAVLLVLIMAIGMIPASLGVSAASGGDTARVDHFQTIGNNYVIQPYIQGLPAGSRFAQYQGVHHDDFNIAYVSVNGGAPQMAYCLEYGVDLHSGNHLSGSTYESLSPDQQRYIALATMFGYNDLTSANPNWQFYSYGWDAAMATQIMIWQIVEGTFDYSTSDVAGVEAEVMHSLSACSNYTPASVVDVYRALKILVMQSKNIPQCAGNRPSTSPSYTLTWNAANNRYETVVNDPSGMLAYYDFSANGLMHQKLSDTQMLVWTDQPNLQNVVSTGTSNLVAWGTHLNGCFWELVPDFWESSDIQDLVTVHQGDADPVQCYMRFSVEAQGSVRIVKTAEDGNVAGIRMNISGNGINRDVTTGPDGSVQVDGLNPGTYTVTEYPSENYVPQAPQQVTVVSGQTATVTFNNVLKWGYVSGLKVDRETGNTIAGATFGIFSENETEFTAETSFREPVVTGADGKFTFYMPYGNYQIKELAPAPNYLPNDTIYQVSITENGQVIEITVTNDQVPEIWTEATVDGSKETHPFEQVTLTDTVSYQHLLPGQEYTISGVLMDKATGEAFLVDGEEITSEVTFVPEEANGQVEAEFTFDASGITVDTDLVVFESLYKDGVELTVHADIEDEGQTVTVKIPEIGTEATAEGEKETHPFEQVTITDTVSYTNLIPGQEYTITGVLMDKATGEAFLVDGEEITSEVTFVPEEANGQVDAEFVFDASGITVNTDLVAFETLFQDDIELAVHADIEDEDQTVTVKVPGIGTVATVDGDKETHPFEQVTITDTVSYTNLIPGQEYTITGVLMDKATGEAFLVDGEDITSEVTFVPEEANGQVDAEFVFDASGITVNTDLVAFETLSQDGVELAVHADIEDEGQTVTVKVPDLHTTATIDGNKDAVKGGTVTIEDVVDYTGLIPGKEYTLTGVLMDKATGEAFLVNGQQVTSEVTFTPETADGSVTVTFAFDTSAITEDTSIVVFESLYQNGTELTTHADITDEAQTVTITVPAPVPKTDDNSNLPIAMALGGLLLSLAAGGYIFFLLRRKRN